VSYAVELNIWASFHDYVPYKYSRCKTSLFSISDLDTNATGTTTYTRFWAHDDESNRGSFYGTDYTTEFEFIYNASKDMDKIFYSFQYMVDIYEEAESGAMSVLTHDHGFDSFYVYTTHQHSGESPIEYMINTRRIGNDWKINKFRDLAALETSQAQLYTGTTTAFTGSNFGVVGANVAGAITTEVDVTAVNEPMFIIEGMNETVNASFIDVTKSWDRQRKFRDKWVGIRLKYSNITKKLINLYSTDVAAKKFYR
jgi:hypothetical protein